MLRPILAGGALALSLSQTMPAFAEFRRIETEAEFVAVVSSHEWHGPAIITIHDNGTFQNVTKRRRMVGGWNWQQGFFCRTYNLAGDAGATDCQTVGIDGNRVEFRGQHGRAEPVIYQMP